MESVIDMDQLLVFCSNSPDMATKVIQAYVSVVPRYIQDAKDAVATNDPAIIRAMCHKLSGAAKSVRAPKVVQSVEYLRELVINQQTQKIPAALSEVCSAQLAVVHFAKQNNIIN